MTPVVLAPDAVSWDPHDDSWDEREDAFLDCQGEPAAAPPAKRRRLIVEEDLCEDIGVSGPQWEAAIDSVCAENDIFLINPQDYEVSEVDASQADPSVCHANLDPENPAHEDFCPPEHFATASVVDMTGLLDEKVLAEALGEKWVEAKTAMAAGSQSAANPQDSAECELFLDIEAAATQAGIPSSAVTKEMLSKVWRISEDEARRTLEATTQLNRQDANSTLSRNFGTNDRMLRHERIDSLFFVDTFCVTKKAKSVRGFTVMQLFASDKGFVKARGVKSETEILSAVRLFCKEAGAPNAFVCDPHEAGTNQCSLISY